MRKIALTGISGLVGRHILQQCSVDGIICVTSSRTQPENLSPATWHQWDLSQWKKSQDLDLIYPDVEGIFHIGAYIPENLNGRLDRKSLFDINVRSCACLAAWASERQIPLLYLSSPTVYADVYKRRIKENDEKTTLDLKNYYTASKLLAETTLMMHTQGDLKLCILRPSSIYGYGLPDSKMLARFIHRAANNETIELYPPVNEKVNFIHALDVARALLAALHHKAWGVFNIAGSRSHSIVEVAKTSIRVVGQGQVAVISQNHKAIPKTRFDLDCKAAKRAFGYTSTIGLTDGLIRMWNDMRNLHPHRPVSS